ncbi:NUDIX hydrolase [Shewanella woodyi]|uniref:NUDIX hydrolase n=1 Tax=Shewanella woodyi TaxID=60961 RepID=UPI003747F041
MAFDDKFRLSSHAVIFDSENRVLLLKATYGDKHWGLPGGALDVDETIHEALLRECREELGCEVKVSYLSGVYYHKAYDSQAFIFRCELEDISLITLSDEHSEFKFEAVENLSSVQQRRVRQCLAFDGQVMSDKF